MPVECFMIKYRETLDRKLKPEPCAWPLKVWYAEELFDEYDMTMPLVIR